MIIRQLDIAENFEFVTVSYLSVFFSDILPRLGITRLVLNDFIDHVNCGWGYDCFPEWNYGIGYFQLDIGVTFLQVIYTSLNVNLTSSNQNMFP
jgi:hypothetical protein